MKPTQKQKPKKNAPLVHEPGMLYRVRCKDWERVWGEGLSWEAAHRLKEHVAGRRLSKTVRVEPMSVPAPKNAPPIEPIGAVALANAVRPDDSAADDDLDVLEDEDDAGDIDRLVDNAVLEDRAARNRQPGGALGSGGR